MHYLYEAKGLPTWLSGKASACQCRGHGFNPWVGKIPWREGMAAHCNLLAWEVPHAEGPGGLQSVGSQSRT